MTSNHASESRIFYESIKEVMESIWEKPYKLSCFLCVKKRTRAISFYELSPYIKEPLRPDFWEEFLESIEEFNEHAKTHEKLEVF